DPIWQWVANVVMQKFTTAHVEQLEAAIAANNTTQIAQLARDFQDAAAPRMQIALDGVRNDDRALRRFTLEVGTPLAFEDIQIIVGVLKARDGLASLAEQMPRHIKSLSGPVLESVKSLLDSPAGRGPDIFPFALIMVMGRLAAPWQLIRLATSAAGSDVAA